MHELRDIFATVALDHPDAFIAGLHSVGHPHQFAALWAQFIDRHGAVKPSLAAPFLTQVGTATNATALDEAFPRDVLATTGDVTAFYGFFGCTDGGERGGPE